MTAKSTTRLKGPSKLSAANWQPPLQPDGVTPRKRRPPCARSSKKRWLPHEYQKRALRFLLGQAVAALFLDPGLGKTSITFAAFKILKRDGQLKGAFVIAPRRPMHLVWPKEAEKWEDFEDLKVGKLYGTDQEIERVLADPDVDVFVTNHDSIRKFFARTRRGKSWKYHLTAIGEKLMARVNVLVLDELSKFKHTDTLRFKLLEPHLGKFDRRYGLTGSPAPNGLLDLFGQCLILDGGNALGPYVTHYRATYFQPVADYTWGLKPFAEEAIHERLRPLAISMEAKDYLKLPILMPIPIKLDLPPEARARYDEVEEQYLTIIEHEALTAPNAAAANMMCRQICSGNIYLPEFDAITGVKKAGPRKWLHLHDEKIEALKDLVEELQGQQLLIAYEFKHDLEAIKAAFPGIAVFGKSDREDERIEREWNEGTLQLAVGHPASIGHGLNLQESNAHNICWYSLTWDFELFDQYVRRLMRQGNKAQYVHNYFLVMRDSVEESLVAVLKGKERTQNRLKSALRMRERIDD